MHLPWCVIGRYGHRENGEVRTARITEHSARKQAAYAIGRIRGAGRRFRAATYHEAVIALKRIRRSVTAGSDVIILLAGESPAVDIERCAGTGELVTSRVPGGG